MELALQTQLNNSMKRHGDRNIKCPKWPFFQHIKRKFEYCTHRCDCAVVLASNHPRKYPNPYLIKAYDLHSIMRSTSRKNKKKKKSRSYKTKSNDIRRRSATGAAMTRVRSRAMTTTAGMTASPNSRCLLNNSRVMRVVQEQRKQRSPEEECRLHDTDREGSLQHSASLVDVQR